MDIFSTKFKKRIFPVIFIMMFAYVTAQTVHASSLESESAINAYKKAEKTCKQMERDHEKMKGEHKLMFKAWQEKSSPLLKEDEEVLTECKNTLLDETLFNDYEKIQSIMEVIAGRHKTLREKHERLFHEMMGH